MRRIILICAFSYKYFLNECTKMLVITSQTTLLAEADTRLGKTHLFWVADNIFVTLHPMTQLLIVLIAYFCRFVS